MDTHLIFHHLDSIYGSLFGIMTEAQRYLNLVFKKGHWLGFAWSAGDAFTYFIETERPAQEGRPVVIIC